MRGHANVQLSRANECDIRSWKSPETVFIELADTDGFVWVILTFEDVGAFETFCHRMADAVVEEETV